MKEEENQQNEDCRRGHQGKRAADASSLRGAIAHLHECLQLRHCRWLGEAVPIPCCVRAHSTVPAVIILRIVSVDTKTIDDRILKQ